VVADRSRWSSLRPYVEAVLDRFGTDERIVLWDLWNEPDSPNPAYAHRDPAKKGALVGELLELVWDWAAAVDPQAPLSVGVYLFPEHHPERASTVARTAIERSDVITFHSYAAEAGLIAAIDALARHGRPLVCTEWMGRPRSPVSLVRVLRDRRVGAYTWGLVDGRTQTRYSWNSWLRPDPPGAPWFHELLHPDGRPYDEAEAALLREVSPR
jgi:GH35 family endo-1,4-beta-xylanase